MSNIDESMFDFSELTDVEKMQVRIQALERILADIREAVSSKNVSSNPMDCTAMGAVYSCRRYSEEKYIKSYYIFSLLHFRSEKFHNQENVLEKSQSGDDLTGSDGD